MDKEVKDLRDLVVINDIRFDLNKFNIRTDAATAKQSGRRSDE